MKLGEVKRNIKKSHFLGFTGHITSACWPCGVTRVDHAGAGGQTACPASQNVGAAGAVISGRWGQSLTSHSLLASPPTKRHWEVTSQSCYKILCNACPGRWTSEAGVMQVGGNSLPRYDSSNPSPLPSPEDLVCLNHWVYIAVPGSSLRKENYKLASKSSTSISKISPETLLQCRHIPQNIKTKMLILSPSQSDRSPEPKLKHRLLSHEVWVWDAEPHWDGAIFQVTHHKNSLPCPSIQ